METKRKTVVGTVASKKTEKTAIVEIERLRRHPVYRKMMRRVVKYKVHDADNACAVGDTVRLIETRPISKEKHWKIVEIITKGEVAEIKPEEIK